MALTVILRCFFMGRWPWLLSFREKKPNSNRAKGVGVLSILANVNLQKIDLSRPNCINGLKHSHDTGNQKLNWILLKMSKAIRKDKLQCSQVLRL
jgi:hypothetical protein